MSAETEWWIASCPESSEHDWGAQLVAKRVVLRLLALGVPTPPLFDGNSEYVWMQWSATFETVVTLEIVLAKEKGLLAFFVSVAPSIVPHLLGEDAAVDTIAKMSTLQQAQSARLN